MCFREEVFWQAPGEPIAASSNEHRMESAWSVPAWQKKATIRSRVQSKCLISCEPCNSLVLHVLRIDVDWFCCRKGTDDDQDDEEQL